ncbi:putative protein OS=Streptomyces aurantiogriseus OX=66870 GN=GCM10010251_16710 PE=4 SV=1 [Streptomyces aurantiogriseus]|uniref:DUF3885 domain-containing protein n=1 Tax=Streptomyces aurantiogriseus TaxID=66870 RepID=A0A918C1R3_9ACTN|nr:hypothetical protein [Streptomyces aurantiogriseus]GGR01704.1 hypothetical protein GCM10010251_16710 [Streptomyces aurantiogriseus]
MSRGVAPTLLEALWQERRPSGPPIAHTFRTTYADHWVRFHSLPGSKRYPESEDEYAIVLDRYNTVLDDLFADTDVFVVTMDWSNTPTGPAGYPTPRQELHPDGIHWWTEPDVDDFDPEFHTYTRLYADRRPWRPGCVDDLLRAVADEAVVEVFITDTNLRRIHHPYDGGADIILTTPAERDELRDRHADWLSSHPAGL